MCESDHVAISVALKFPLGPPAIWTTKGCVMSFCHFSQVCLSAKSSLYFVHKYIFYYMDC